jgi:hypothetical protein
VRATVIASLDPAVVADGARRLLAAHPERSAVEARFGRWSMAVVVAEGAIETRVSVDAARAAVVVGWLCRHDGNIPDPCAAVDLAEAGFACAESEALVIAVDQGGPRWWTDPHSDCPTFTCELPGEGIAISTSIRGLAPLLDRPRLSRVGAAMSLMMAATRHPWSVVDGIERSLPGHRHHRSLGRTVAEPWFRRRLQRHVLGRPDLDHIEAALVDAVRLRILDAGHPAALLSSGLDSYLVAAVVRRSLGRPLDTFTFRYEGTDGPWNEDTVAVQRAAELGATCQVVEVTPEWLAGEFEQLVRTFQGPIAIGIHTAALQRIGAVPNEVLLSGMDLEEYYVHFGPAVARAATLALPSRLLASSLTRAAHSGRSPWNSSVRRMLEFGGTGTRVRTVALPVLERLLGGELVEEVIVAAHDELRRDVARHRHEWLIDRIGFSEDVTWWGAAGPYWTFRWAERSGMAARFPLDDSRIEHELAGYLFRGPDRIVFREALDRILGRHVDVPKYGQRVPLDPWIRGALGDAIEAPLQRADRLGLWDPDVGLALLDEHRRGELDIGLLLVVMASMVIFDEQLAGL